MELYAQLMALSPINDYMLEKKYLAENAENAKMWNQKTGVILQDEHILLSDHISAALALLARQKKSRRARGDKREMSNV